MCGLKLPHRWEIHPLWVTPYVGVWIETLSVTNAESGMLVTPYVGVWIETI